MLYFLVNKNKACTSWGFLLNKDRDETESVVVMIKNGVSRCSLSRTNLVYKGLVIDLKAMELQ